MAAQSPTVRTEGHVQADAGFAMANSVLIFSKAGVPSDGTSGDGVGLAGPGSLCVDATNKDVYMNTGTKASPTWTKKID